MGAGVSVAASGLGTGGDPDDDRIAEAHTLYVELQPSLRNQAGMVAEQAFNNARLMEFVFGEGQVGSGSPHHTTTRPSTHLPRTQSTAPSPLPGPGRGSVGLGAAVGFGAAGGASPTHDHGAG